MKIDRTKYTAHYENGVVVAQWISIEMALDGANGESPLDALDRSQELVQQWYKSKNLPFSSTQPDASFELPVINKAEERLGMLIENATTKEELMNYQHELKTPYLADLFSSKLQQLTVHAK
jgi:hypothetical protein